VRVDAAAAIFATTCDQMRRAIELAGQERTLPLFLLQVPHTWQTTAARRYYAAELDRLGRFLESCGGRVPTDAELARVMRAHDDARRERTGDGGVDRAGGVVPLAVVGGPLCEEDRVIFELVARARGAVVLDATEYGERALPLPFDRRQLDSDVRGELATAYFDGIADAGRRPNSELYKWLKVRMAERAVRGIIFVCYAWCDTWHAEAARMREWAGLPFLQLELTGERGAAAMLEHRVQAFFETVRCDR
jgi:benzoyl-CoA reductase/2-hydroxyglutaryl-CoA dehydratase subunit BcrC/BadD/HgdB